MKIKAKIMDERKVKKTLKRLALEVIEKNRNPKELAIIGIRTRGVYIGKRIHEIIEKEENIKIPFGILDITLYRDDLSVIGPNPLVKATEINFDVNDKNIILVDDVLFTGRTIRAALSSIIDFGRPKRVQLLVLIDRGHREFPICADFIGKTLPTMRREIVDVRVKEVDGADEVLIIEKEE